jgi:hypothetical protein
VLYFKYKKNGLKQKRKRAQNDLLKVSRARLDFHAKSSFSSCARARETELINKMARELDNSGQISPLLKLRNKRSKNLLSSEPHARFASLVFPFDLIFLQKKVKKSRKKKRKKKKNCIDARFFRSSSEGCERARRVWSLYEHACVQHDALAQTRERREAAHKRTICARAREHEREREKGPLWK